MNPTTLLMKGIINHYNKNKIKFVDYLDKTNIRLKDWYLFLSSDSIYEDYLVYYTIYVLDRNKILEVERYNLPFKSALIYIINNYSRSDYEEFNNRLLKMIRKGKIEKLLFDYVEVLTSNKYDRELYDFLYTYLDDKVLVGGTPYLDLYKQLSNRHFIISAYADEDERLLKEALLEAETILVKDPTHIYEIFKNSNHIYNIVDYIYETNNKFC